MPLSIRTFPLVALLALVLLMPGSALAVERTVSVTGTATQQVPNDTAGLGFSVTKERRSRAAALRIVSIRLRQVIAAVQESRGSVQATSRPAASRSAKSCAANGSSTARARASR